MEDVKQFFDIRLATNAPQTAREVLEWRIRIKALAAVDGERFLRHAACWLARYCKIDDHGHLQAVEPALFLTVRDGWDVKLVPIEIARLIEDLIGDVSLPESYLAELETLLLRFCEVEGVDVPKVGSEVFDGISNFTVLTNAFAFRSIDMDLSMPWWQYQIATMHKRVMGISTTIAREKQKDTENYEDALKQLKGLMPG